MTRDEIVRKIRDAIGPVGNFYDDTEAASQVLTRMEKTGLRVIPAEPDEDEVERVARELHKCETHAINDDFDRQSADLLQYWMDSATAACRAVRGDGG